MKVGLDAYTLRESQLGFEETLDWVVAHRLEGVQIGEAVFYGRTDAEITALAQHAAKLGLYLELAGPSVNPSRAGSSIGSVVERWRRTIPLAARVGAGIVNTSFGLIRERISSSPGFAYQLAMTERVLRTIAPVAADNGVTVTLELHVDLTSRELLRLIESVGSPHIAVNLDTANACGLLEDPVDAAARLAPHVRTAHLKDTCVYRADEGYWWAGGSVLGRGLVDLPAVVELLYQANPDIHLNIEDSGGYLLIPAHDEAFLASFPDLTPQAVVDFGRFLDRGEALVRSGVHPTEEESRSIDWKNVIETRMQYNADYALRLRDQVVGGSLPLPTGA